MIDFIDLLKRVHEQSLNRLKPQVAKDDKFRYIEVHLQLGEDTLIYDNDNFNIDFILEIDRTSHSNVLELNIYNIKYEQNSQYTLEYNFLKANPIIKLYAGYRKDLLVETPVDLIYQGQLVSVKPEHTKDSMDISFRFICVQEQEIWVNQILNVSLPKDIKPSEVIRQIVEKVGTYTDENGNTLSLQIGKLYIEGDGGRDIPYKSGYSKSNTSLQKILEDIAKDTFCYFYIENSLLYFVPIVKPIEEVTYIPFVELLSITADDDGYSVKTGFRNVRVNTLLEVEGLEKQFCVDEISHRCDGEDGEFTSTFKILDMDILGQNIYKKLEEEKWKAEENIAKRAEREAAREAEKAERERRRQ